MKFLQTFSFITAAVSAAVPYQDFPGYLKRMSNCQQCIDAIGKREFSKICTGPKDEIYCCNSKPSEPPHSNMRSHDPFLYQTQTEAYLEYGKKSNEKKIEAHEEYCGGSDVSCVEDWQMHAALATCFGDEKSTQENCQSNNQTNVAEPGESILFGSDYENKMKNAGRLDGDNTKHFAQQWPETWAHNQTQTIVSKQKGIAAGVKTCIWNIKTSYKKKYLRLQDLYL